MCELIFNNCLVTLDRPLNSYIKVKSRAGSKTVVKKKDKCRPKTHSFHAILTCLHHIPGVWSSEVMPARHQWGILTKGQLSRQTGFRSFQNNCLDSERSFLYLVFISDADLTLGPESHCSVSTLWASPEAQLGWRLYIKWGSQARHY